MAKFDESRKRTALLAPAVIILFCSALSVVANYEDAATQNPAAYANVSLFTQPALIVNPILISAPPVFVLLLILLVPSVLAQPRIKSVAEIAAQADEQEALIAANGRLREARVKANARVRDVRLRGFVDTVSSMTTRVEETSADIPPALADEDDPEDTQPRAARMTAAMWKALKLPERVVQSGIITPQEVAEVLDISLSHARNLTKEVESGKQTVQGRSGVSYMDLIEALYDRRTKDSYTWARKLETTLGVRKRARQLQVVPDDSGDDLLEEQVDWSLPT
jgi:hypothetical protein